MIYDHKLAKWFYKNNKHYKKLDVDSKYLCEEIFNLMLITSLVSLLIGIVIGSI